MASNNLRHVVQPIQNEPAAAKEDQGQASLSELTVVATEPITNINARVQKGNVASSAAFTEAGNGTDSPKTTPATVLHDYFCDGEDCIPTWNIPIDGARYVCVSCTQAKYQHVLCSNCYEKYPLKSAEMIENSEANEAEASSILTAADKKDCGSSQPMTSRGGPEIAKVVHVFRCINDERTDTKPMDAQANSNLIQCKLAGYTDFNTMKFVTQVLVLYPVGFALHLADQMSANPVDSKNARNFVDRFIIRTRKLPIFQIGVCWVLNILAIILIYYATYKYGKIMTAYWIFLYELFFVQSVAVQVQQCVTRTRTSCTRFVVSALTGISFITHDESFSIMESEILPLVLYRRKHQASAIGTMRFLFSLPSPMINASISAGQERELEPSVFKSTVDPAKHLFSGPRKPIMDSAKAIFFVIAGISFVTFVIGVNAMSMIPTTLMGVFDNRLHIPQMTEYHLSWLSVNEACLANNSTGNSSEAMARVFVNLHLNPMPSVDGGLPVLRSWFVTTNGSTEVRSSIEQIWGASYVNSWSDAIDLQLLAKHDIIGIVLSLPDIPCRYVPDLSVRYRFIYPTSLEGFDDLRYRNDVPTLWLLLLFYFCIVVPSVIFSIGARACYLCVAIFRTWDYWKAFDAFTKNGKRKGVWVPDCQAKFRIDFMLVENCQTWFEFRKQLIEITSINMRFVIPLLRIAMVQFVLSMAAICWFVVVGRAPIPGFLLLICLCSNSVTTLLLLYPLHNIWKIQYSHIALMSEKYLEAEALSLSDDPQILKRQQHVARLLNGIKNALESCDERVSLLGFEVSSGFLWTLATIAVSGISFFCGSNLQYYVMVN